MRKLLVIIPDGVSLRNFVYTDFYKQGIAMGYAITFLNLTPFELAELGLEGLRTKSIKPNPWTEPFKNAKKRVELNMFKRRNADMVYDKYWFPLRIKSLGTFVKHTLTKILVLLCNSESGLLFLRRHIRVLESKTPYYRSCVALMEQVKPDLVYCASQRALLGIAPVEAAKSLDIPTVGFVFSWDNLPKATLDVETDHYHVWSTHMQQELLHYYRFVEPDQITVTGTPQFEPHYQTANIMSKTAFYNTHGLNADTTYICFSGDDVTTSPQDSMYLRDVAQAISKLNAQGHQLGIIFRRCPVDFSNRYDAVLETYSDIIVPIAPLWEQKGAVWNAKLPTQADTVLLANIAAHCAAVVNLGSSMVFDFAIHNKPCGYMNYHYLEDGTIQQGVHGYDYVHFRSMPNKTAVVWLDAPERLPEQLALLLEGQEDTVKHAKDWLVTIAGTSPETASHNILQALTHNL